MNERYPVAVLGIEIFTANGWDMGGDWGDCLYYEVEFLIDELKEHNGKCVNILLGESKIEILGDEEGDSVEVDLWELEGFKKLIMVKME